MSEMKTIETAEHICTPFLLLIKSCLEIKFLENIQNAETHFAIIHTWLAIEITKITLAEKHHNMTHEERQDLYHWYNEAKDGMKNC